MRCATPAGLIHKRLPDDLFLALGKSGKLAFHLQHRAALLANKIPRMVGRMIIHAYHHVSHILQRCETARQQS